MGEPIVVSEAYPVTTAVLWKAITDQAQMKTWFFGSIKVFRPVVGFETEFDVDCDGTIYPHQWKVIDVVEGSKIAYQWRYGGIEGDSVVCWDVTAEGDSARLTLTHTVIEQFDADDPNLGRDACEGGWNYFLKQSLSAHLGAS